MRHGVGRPPAPAPPTIKIELETTPQVAARLDELVRTGYFGRTAAETAEQLLRERLREIHGFERPQRGGRARRG